jgi:hypothetical protein
LSTYRICFHDAARIVGRQDFTADDDQSAATIGDVLCDACSDRCDSFEVWNGDHRVVGRSLHSPRSADVILGRCQASLVSCEEAIQRSKWAVAKSAKLLERIDELRATDAPRSRAEA